MGPKQVELGPKRDQARPPLEWPALSAGGPERGRGASPRGFPLPAPRLVYGRATEAGAGAGGEATDR